jgi:putative endonuclease
MKKYYTYIARCSDDSLYTGYCVDLKEREEKHNLGEGARYTRARRPIQMVYHEEYPTRSEAMRREYEIKTWSRKKKEELLKKSAKKTANKKKK